MSRELRKTVEAAVETLKAEVERTGMAWHPEEGVITEVIEKVEGGRDLEAVLQELRAAILTSSRNLQTLVEEESGAIEPAKIQ